MQFQDITRQRIEHVIDPLQKLKADSEIVLSRLKNVDETLHDRIEVQSTSWLEKMYTMESERAVMKSTLHAQEGK